MVDPADIAIGLDFGTSSLKVVARDSFGRVHARIRRDYPTARPERDAAEQDPAQWLAACDDSMRELADTVSPSRWGAIALSAMLPTLVSLDTDLATHWPAITWEDARADQHGEELRRAVGGDQLYARTGQQVDGRYLLPMHARRRRLRGGAEAVWAVGAKDYIYLRLTGELLTDPSTASGYGAWDLAGDWIDDVLQFAGRPIVPPVVAATAHRPLSASVAARWGCSSEIPVLVGAADSVLGAYGLGIEGQGAIACIAGTSTVILGWSDAPTVDPHGSYIVTPMAGEGFGLELDLLATGSALAWLAGLFGLTDGAEAIARIAESVGLEDAPLVLPYLAPGEQGALWDPDLVGSIEGLSLRSTQAELARGLIAGIVTESRRCVEVLDSVFGKTGRPILLSGSGGRSSLLRQDLADATRREVWFDANEADHSALGAALLAGRTVLGWAPVSPAADSSGLQITRPDDERAAAWDRHYDAHERARAAQRGRRHPHQGDRK